MKKPFFAIALLVCLITVPAVAQTFADFSAIKMDKEVVEDVFTQGNDIYVKITERHRGATFTVRISNRNGSDYRTWSDGEKDMAVKVYRSQAQNRQGYTYRVNTAAPYVEYWLDGRLVLHLERTT